MSASYSGRRRPSQEEFIKIIRSLNEDYGLDLHSPDATVSPSKRRLQRISEDQRESQELYHRLHSGHFRGSLPRRLGQFKSEAQQISRDWVDKPHADPTTLPDISAPLGARSYGERAALRSCLRDILVGSGPHKRHSDDYSDGPSRRTRSRLSGSGDDYETIDSIPFRSRPSEKPQVQHGQAVVSQQYREPLSAGLSANSSRVSFSSTVFSATEAPEHTPDTSQGTRLELSHNYDPCADGCEALKASSKFEGSKQPTSTRLHGEKAVGAEKGLNSHRRLEDDMDTSFDGIDEQLLPGVLNPDQQFENIWPAFPIPGLNEAPLAVIWEVTRAAVYCKVDLRSFDLTYNPNESFWHNQDLLWAELEKHRLFLGKNMPAKCNAQAWAAALNGFQSPKRFSVVLSAELVRVSQAVGEPMFETKLHPLNLSLGHRLDRRFGADRFLEVLMPSLPKIDEGEASRIVHWLCHRMHYFLGRAWVPFFTKQDKKTIKDLNDPKKNRDIFQERLYFFATNGIHFRSGSLPPLEEATNPQSRTKLSYAGLLEWAINPRVAPQPVPKLFSRISLSLSRTHPAALLEKHQIHHRPSDILSMPDGRGKRQEMNDGIGRMSRRLAKEIADYLDLTDTPSGFQGRFGSAKGMWIIDVDDEGDDRWIETYPSQRKWECDFDDPHHRTFEVREFPKELHSALLNQQFIPILEAQSRDPQEMRRVIAQKLEQCLCNELDARVMDHPAKLRSWLKESGVMSKDRAANNDFVAFLGGLPENDAEKIAFLLDSGFDSKTKLLQDLIWKMGKDKATQLKAKLKIQVPCSTYAFMVVDFCGVLEPGEVHLSFSSKFQVEGFSDTLLEGMDILVARAPAHFPSDIQKVRVVSKPQLRRLKDVIVFPTKGEWPLADLLSGGDYDGDQAWICWDQNIVRNFNNAGPPPTYDFISEGFLKKQNLTFQGLWDRYGDFDEACDNFRYMGISFNMQPSLLGQCTRYKEKLCYHRDRINSDTAICLSTLLSNLVDQFKAGITFTQEDWLRFRTERLNRQKGYDDPEYTKDKASDSWRRKREQHILDYLKFSVAGEVVEKALTDFWRALQAVGALQYDEHLVKIYDSVDSVKHSHGFAGAFNDLENKIEALRTEWCCGVGGHRNDDAGFKDRVKRIYEQWAKISPPEDLKKNSKTISQPGESSSRSIDTSASQRLGTMLGTHDWSAKFSPWSLLKASVTFNNCHKFSYNLVWYMAGRQLAHMKAEMVSAEPELEDTSPVLVVPGMYYILRPDKKSAKNLADRSNRVEENDSVVALNEVMDFDDDGTVIDDA